MTTHFGGDRMYNSADSVHVNPGHSENPDRLSAVMRYLAAIRTRLAILVVLAATGSVLTAQSSATINILGQLGSLSFAPNPAVVNQGGTLQWNNTDTVVHRIVLDDGSLDTGNIPAGGSSPFLTLTTSGGPYHCSIHPSMVGTINLAVPTMSQKVTLVLALLLASLGYLQLRRKNRTSPTDTE